jgi:cytoskeleton protein RodZ
VSEPEVLADETTVDRLLPGSMLRQAREAQGLTLGEVAGALKFSTRQIEALENDNFEALQGKTFLRGFIRAYARMLKLQPEELLAMLEAETLPVSEQIVPPMNMGETDPMPFYRRNGKAVLALLLLVLAIAVAAWWHGDRLADSDSVIGVVPPATVVPAAPADVNSTAQSSASETVAPPGAIAPSAPALTFDFSDLSWLEVKDADGKVLLTGEFPAGQRQATTGKPPYQLWIGRASAVKVIYNNQPVDLQPYTRDEVARLTLDH